MTARAEACPEAEDIAAFVTGGLPAPDLFPLEAVQAATERALARHGSRTLQYGESEGVAELRIAADEPPSVLGKDGGPAFPPPITRLAEP